MAEIYKMTVDLNVLDHLGINLYSNIADVLTETVANAWDADAETVDIKLDPEGNWIETVDDGIGKSVDDMNGKYLRVGYPRREKDTKYGKTIAKSRPVMGRKGLGKMSLFSITNTIEVESAREGATQSLRMTVDGIQESVQKKEPFYSTEFLRADQITVAMGTPIFLRDIKRHRLGRGALALRKRLARRFSMIEEASNPDRLKSSMTSISPGSRIVHYDTLFKGAREGYSAYMEKSKSLDRLESIVDKI